MTERPILFSAPMVRALLDGTKTQTRRVVKNPALLWLEQFEPKYVALPGNHLSPYGYAGDRLWVRETWGVLFDDAADRDDPTWWAADYAPGELDQQARPRRWRPSIHMPRWRSRIDLDVTGVRIERLQDISYDDAVAEGIAHDYPKAVAQYRDLWEDINGAGSWATNPWVWVIEFRRI